MEESDAIPIHGGVSTFLLEAAVSVDIFTLMDHPEYAQTAGRMRRADGPTFEMMVAHTPPSAYADVLGYGAPGSDMYRHYRQAAAVSVATKPEVVDTFGAMLPPGTMDGGFHDFSDIWVAGVAAGVFRSFASCHPSPDSKAVQPGLDHLYTAQMRLAQHFLAQRLEPAPMPIVGRLAINLANRAFSDAPVEDFPGGLSPIALAALSG